mgnify:FL=1
MRSYSSIKQLNAMNFVRLCHVAFIASGWVVLLSPLTPCKAFVPRPEATKPILAELHLKSTVSENFSFSKPSGQSEDSEYSTDDDEEDVYHRRIVHFELDSEKVQERDEETTAEIASTPKFGWDHHDFTQSVDP